MNGQTTKKEVFTKPMMAVNPGKKYCMSMKKPELMIWLCILRIRILFTPQPGNEFVKNGTIQERSRIILKPVFIKPVSYTHLRAHETKANLVCRLLLEKKK